jgi:hypothetical protein
MEGLLHYEVTLEEYRRRVEAHRQGDTRGKLRIPTLFEEACYRTTGHTRTARFLCPAGTGQNRGRLRQNHETERKPRLPKTSALNTKSALRTAKA